MSDEVLGAVLKFILSACFVGLVISLLIVKCKDVIENLVHGVKVHYKQFKEKFKKKK